MPRIFCRVSCLKCPLDDVCEWSASENIAIDKDGYTWVKIDEDRQSLDIADANCPLKKTLILIDEGMGNK